MKYFLSILLVLTVFFGEVCIEYLCANYSSIHLVDHNHDGESESEKSEESKEDSKLRINGIDLSLLNYNDLSSISDCFNWNELPYCQEVLIPPPEHSI